MPEEIDLIDAISNVERQNILKALNGGKNEC